MKRLGLSLSFVFFPLLALASTQAKFSLVATTNTSVAVPSNRYTYIQYTVTNNTAYERTLTMVPIQGLTQVTEDSSQCANPFTLASHASCKLTFLIDGAQLSAPISGGPVICKTQGGDNTPDPYMCSQPEPSMILAITPTTAVSGSTNQLYVSNWNGDSISLCDISQGSLIHCSIAAVSSTFASPEALAINNDVLFIANIGGAMSSCRINAVDGSLSGCKSAAVSSAPIYAPTGIAILSGKAYISNSGPAAFEQGITVCDVSDDLLTNCAFTQGNASFSVPSDLAINNGSIYVTNFNSSSVATTYCTLASPLCTTASGEGEVSGTSTLLSEPEGLFFTTLNSINYAYFTNHENGAVIVCQVQSESTFANCASSGDYFFGFGNLTTLNSALKAYVPSGLKTIAVCDINASDGSLSQCSNALQTNFNNPSGLIIR